MFRSLIQKLRQHNHIEPTFTASIEEVNHFKALINNTSCVACNQKTLQLNRFVHAVKGWDAEVSCTNCNFNGVVNSTGFDFKQVSSKGKARE